MTKSKHLKRRVRDRMEKTGESYAAAREHVVSANGTGPVPPVAANWVRIVADDKLTAATGRNHDAWFALLDAWQAWESEHGRIVTWLQAEHAVPGWWSQTITVSYERAHGLRVPNRNKDGFNVSVTKTVPRPVEELFDLAHARLSAEAEAVRTATRPRSARYDWSAGRVLAGFEATGDTKSRISIQHERLPDAEAVDTWRAFWKTWLAELAA